MWLCPVEWKCQIFQPVQKCKTCEQIGTDLLARQAWLCGFLLFSCPRFWRLLQRGSQTTNYHWAPLQASQLLHARYFKNSIMFLDHLGKYLWARRWHRYWRICLGGSRWPWGWMVFHSTNNSRGTIQQNWLAPIQFWSKIKTHGRIKAITTQKLFIRIRNLKVIEKILK